MKVKIMSMPLLLMMFLFLNCGENQQKSNEENKNDTVKISEKVTKTNQKFDFEDFELNKIPQGWSQYSNGKGSTDWQVVDYDGNNVLGQLASDNPNNHFNVIVYDSLEALNVHLKVRMKAISGHYDQGGGLVWRFQDKDNYYIVRANPLENNVVMYRVKDGIRQDLPLIDKGRTYGMQVENMGKDWHILELTAETDTFTVYFDGKELFKVADKTFTDKGKTGLWTKADAVTYFDDFEISNME